MLLATDLDGTFLAGDPEHRSQVYQLVASHPDIQLAYVTGRGLESVLPLLADPLLPKPDYIICDVGATVVDGATQQPIQPLQTEIHGRWPGEQVVADAFAGFKGLERQATPQERRCSYFCPSSAVTDEILAAAEALDCHILFSADQYLDVLPKGVHKGSTLLRLVDHLGIDRSQVLVAGDTLNDLAMMQTGLKGVCVGESEEGLLEATRALSNILHARKPGCGGILEALGHFGFLGPEGVAAHRDTASKPGTSDLVIVYHRLPYDEVMIDGQLRRRPPQSPNGIIPTLLSFFTGKRRGSWIAWTTHDPKKNDKPFETHVAVDRERYPHLTAARVPLSKSDVDVFYRQFSKEAFWPMLHTFWERARFREDHWKIFLKVNRTFAQAAASEAAEGAIVWIHDYNLWMVPAYLRKLRPDLTLAFFHHTYFPSADVFNVVPWRRQIIGSLLQCDFIGFHIPRQVENFVDVARGVAPVKVVATQSCAPRFLTYGCAMGLDETASTIEVHGRRIDLGAHPVGLDVERVREILGREATRTRMAQLREVLSGKRLILSVERLDYTKGTLEKLLAYEKLLEIHPELQSKISLVVVCVPAAKEMTIYRTLQNQIEQAVGRINGRFSRFGWTPVQFFFRAMPFDELIAYYAMADVMWITPLRDGLNLVSKEYAATQGLTGGRGVLVLSEFAGAAAELKGALLTNPHDPVDLADTCYTALAMGKAEAESRLRTMYDIVCHNDIRRWGDEFLEAVGATRTAPLLPRSAA